MQPLHYLRKHEPLALPPPWPSQQRCRQLADGPIHYIDEGAGPVVFMIHGNPTSKELWRHVVGPVAAHHRVIAADLMGSLATTDADDPLTAEGDRVLALLDALNVDEPVVLLAHDWGAFIAADLVRRHPERVAGVAFCEGLLYGVCWRDYDAVTWFLCRLLQVPLLGWFLLVELNLFLRLFMPLGCRRRMSKETRNLYAARYPGRRGREQIWRWVQTVPGHRAHRYHRRLDESREALLTSTTTKKLFFFGHPGFSMSAQTVADVCRRGTDLTSVDLGPGVHYFPEDEPLQMVAALLPWLDSVWASRPQTSGRQTSSASEGSTASAPSLRASVSR